MGSRGSSMSHYSSGAKRWHYSTLLLLALGAAMLSVLVVHKLREGRVLGLLLRDRESQLFSLQLILERERAHSKEMKAKIEELKAKAASLRSQKLRLSTRLMEAQNLAAHLKNKRTELELALQEKQAKLITSLEGAEEASVKANKQVEALTDMLKQQQQQQGGHGAGEMERRRPQRTATDKVDDDGAKEVESGEHGQGSKGGGGGWVRIETNTNDAEPVVVDGGDGAGSTVKEEIISSDGAKQPEVAADQEGEQNSATVDGDLPVVKDQVATITNTTETNLAAPEDGKPEQKDNSADGDGEEKQTKKDSQHEESSETADQKVIDGNVAEVNGADQVQLKVPEKQTASTQEEVAEVQPDQVISAAVGIVGASGSSGGDENSEAKSTSTESYQDTNGSDQMTINGAADDRTVSDNKESNTSSEGGGAALREEGEPENKEENSVRSTVETSEQSAASHGEKTENVHGSEVEGESSWKEDQGSGQSGSEQPEEKIAGDEEKKTGDSTSDLTQQGANVDTGSAEEEAASNEAQQE